MKAKGTLKEYRVIGRKMPTESEPVTPLYRYGRPLTSFPEISPVGFIAFWFLDNSHASKKGGQ